MDNSFEEYLCKLESKNVSADLLDSTNNNNNIIDTSKSNATELNQCLKEIEILEASMINNAIDAERITQLYHKAHLLSKEQEQLECKIRQLITLASSNSYLKLSDDVLRISHNADKVLSDNSYNFIADEVVQPLIDYSEHLKANSILQANHITTSFNLVNLTDNVYKTLEKRKEHSNLLLERDTYLSLRNELQLDFSQCSEQYSSLIAERDSCYNDHIEIKSMLEKNNDKLSTLRETIELRTSEAKSLECHTELMMAEYKDHLQTLEDEKIQIKDINNQIATALKIIDDLKGIFSKHETDYAVHKKEKLKTVNTDFENYNLTLEILNQQQVEHLNNIEEVEQEINLIIHLREWQIQKESENDDITDEASEEQKKIKFLADDINTLLTRNETFKKEMEQKVEAKRQSIELFKKKFEEDIVQFDLLTKELKSINDLLKTKFEIKNTLMGTIDEKITELLPIQKTPISKDCPISTSTPFKKRLRQKNDIIIRRKECMRNSRVSKRGGKTTRRGQKR